MTPEAIIQALAEPYPACELEFRTKPFTAVYIDARTPMARLNRVLPLSWSFRLVGEPRRDEAGNVSRDGVLILHLPEGDREFYATGTETPDIGKGEPRQEKGADSDCFKRACFRAGIGAYIYELPKDLPGNSLTAPQVEQAARLAGYQGEIRPEHYGAMRKERARDSFQAEAGGKGRDATPQANGTARPEPATAAVTDDRSSGDAYPLRDRYNQLCKELQAATGHQDTAAFKARLKGSSLWPKTAEAMPGIIRRLEETLAHMSAETNGRGPAPDPFAWDAEGAEVA